METINPINEIDYVSERLKYNDGLILFLCPNSIVIIKDPNDIRRIDTHNWDGIRNNRIENGILKGQLYDRNYNDNGEKYDKTDYELDLKTFILKKGRELMHESVPIKNPNIEKGKVEKSKWWKIW